jgi:hypothetical protein
MKINYDCGINTSRYFLNKKEIKESLHLLNAFSCVVQSTHIHPADEGAYGTNNDYSHNHNTGYNKSCRVEKKYIGIH